MMRGISSSPVIMAIDAGGDAANAYGYKAHEPADALEGPLASGRAAAGSGHGALFRRRNGGAGVSRLLQRPAGLRLPVVEPLPGVDPDGARPVYRARAGAAARRRTTETQTRGRRVGRALAALSAQRALPSHRIHPLA